MPCVQIYLTFPHQQKLYPLSSFIFGTIGTVISVAIILNSFMLLYYRPF